MIRVVVADDEPLARDGLRVVLETQDDIRVVGEAADGEGAVQSVLKLQPDVAVLDVRMPGMDGLTATERIKAESETQVLVLTTFDLDENVYRALKAGAVGFLLKDSTREQLVAAVRTAASGETVLSPRLTRRLVAHYVSRPPASMAQPRGLSELTERERDVLRQVARGLSNSEIANELGVSEGTVKTHVAHLLMKLELRDRTQAAILAYEAGLH